MIDPMSMQLQQKVRDAIHTHFVTLIGKWTISFLPTHPVSLSALSRIVTKLLHFKFGHFATLTVMQISENIFSGENFEGSDNKQKKLACQPS